MVRRAKRVSNHEDVRLILRDAAKWPLLGMRASPLKIGLGALPGTG
jgi:hypothetical protein